MASRLVRQSAKESLTGEDTRRKNGKVLLVETVMPTPPHNEPSMSKLLDVEMLVGLGGRERSEAEYRALLAAAGLKLTKICPTGSPYSVIEGVQA